jgi:dihydropteroate synthase
VSPLAPTRIGPRTFPWGERTFVMGILNITPDSFSGDGLLRAGDAVGSALSAARQMVAAGADLLDVGGESTRPGGAILSVDEERERVVPVLRGLRVAFPDLPLSIDTLKPEVAEAALDAGADLLNDVWGVRDDPAMLRVAAARGVPIVLMHNRSQPVYRNVVSEIVDDLWRALDRARAAGVPDDRVIVDPGIGFGKTADQNLEVLSRLDGLRSLGRPIMLGTSRKSTLGRLLDLPPDQRLDATLATTALGIAAGADIVRVHDVAANVRAARTADAILRGWRPTGWTDAAPPGPTGVLPSVPEAEVT